MNRTKNVFAWLATWGVGLVLLVSSFEHILNPARFAVVVFRYDVLPGFLAGVLATILPFVQLAAGMYLLSNRDPTRAALFAGVLIGIYTVAQGLVVAKGHIVDCGCIGGSSGEVGFFSIIRNLFLVFVCAIAAQAKPAQRLDCWRRTRKTETHFVGVS